MRELGHRCALVGGLAVSARARERFTKDVDLAVAVASDAEAEALALGMQRRGFPLLAVVEQEAKGLVATLRFADPTLDPAEPTIDLLCASCGIEPEIVAAASAVALVAGVVIPIASLAHLVAMKVLSMSDVRDQDRGDVRALLSAASPRDLDDARDAVALIASRGFHRDKDLAAELERMIHLVRQRPAR
ncbi:MAG TPA: nucleotidyl transferase AbiEii/AbiGii toxin family protein [Planctomycetota bacterium]|nr:nucleotidyl transferase AbiEii/AbiGii toxin family protein [Planctomycetota bacterium]